MTEEEKQAIENLKKVLRAEKISELEKENKNLLKENEKLLKVISVMTEYITSPIIEKDGKFVIVKNREEIIEYFYKKVEDGDK